MGVFIFNCPYCGKQIGAQDEWEGKTTMCPHCQKPVVIRHPTPEVPPFDGIPQQSTMSASDDFNVVTHEICPKAMLSFGFGLVSMCCCFSCWIIGIIAIIFGFLGLDEIRKSNGHLEGKAYAWIGIVFGIIQMLIFVLNIIYAPRIVQENKKLLELFKGARFHTEQMEEIHELPVKPLPEPKSEPLPEPESEPNDEPKEKEEPSVPNNKTNDGKEKPDVLI